MVVIQVGPTYLCRQLTRLRQKVLSAVITSPHFIFLNEHYFLIDWTSISQRFYLVYFILEKAASGFPAVLCPSPPPECTLDTDGQDLFLKALCSIKKMLFTWLILLDGLSVCKWNWSMPVCLLVGLKDPYDHTYSESFMMKAIQKQTRNTNTKTR